MTGTPPERAQTLLEAFKALLPEELAAEYVRLVRKPAISELWERSLRRTGCYREPSERERELEENARKGRMREIVAPMIDKLRSGEMVAWAREGSPVSEYRRIPPEAWSTLWIEDLEAGAVTGPNIALFAVKVEAVRGADEDTRKGQNARFSEKRVSEHLGAIVSECSAGDPRLTKEAIEQEAMSFGATRAWARNWYNRNVPKEKQFAVGKRPGRHRRAAI